MTFFHLEHLRFSRVLRTSDRLVRSGRYLIHSLLAVALLASTARGDGLPLRDTVADAAGAVPVSRAPTPKDVPAGRTIRGRLVDESGRPVPGALLSTQGEWTGDACRFGGAQTSPEVSDDDGRFVMIVPEPLTAVSIDVSAEGFAGTRVPKAIPGGAEHSIPVPLGATVTVALHPVQRNRLTLTTVSTGGPSGSSGPQNWRSRRPCPCSATRSPNGVDAVSHRGHWGGRTSETAGVGVHNLTSRLLRTTCCGLRVLRKGSRGARARACSRTPGSPSLSGGGDRRLRPFRPRRNSRSATRQKPAR